MGPLSRPWADIIPDCTLQRACIKHNIHYSEYFILAEAEALWRRVLLVPSAGRGRLRGPSVLEKEKRKSIHGPTIIDQGLSEKPNYANFVTNDFVNITGEPALVAELGWLQHLRLAP